MKGKLQIVVGIVVIAAAAYWMFVTLRSHTYVGSNIMFPIGSGHAIVKNSSGEVMPIELRSGERVASFRISSPELGLRLSAQRQGTGREAFYSLKFDLPPGQARINVESGSGVRMISRAETPIEAKVTPAAPSTIRWVVILSSGAIVWALYYISSATEHRWIASVRRRFTGGGLQPKQTTT